MQFEPQFHAVNGQTIHTMSAGPVNAPVMMMLHGFPEYWAGWSKVAQMLCGRWRVVLPDQRGYNLSSRPKGVDAYEVKHLVADMVALIDELSPRQPIVLCGHDWGASVAYAMAMRHSDRISHLVIANGVHPMCFQKSLLAGGAQTAASQYIPVLRAPDAEERLSANRHEKLFGMLEKFSSATWLDDAARRAYRDVWSKPGALTAMLNWYRASPLVVPPVGAPAQSFHFDAQILARYRISLPHLLLWGMQDTALLPESRADIVQFCEDLTLHELADAGHWILHENPQWVASRIQAFVE